MSALEQVIGNESRTHDADVRGQKWQRRHKAHSDLGHAAIFDEVRREPGQEKPENRRKAKLADEYTPDIAILQHVPEVGPATFLGTFLVACVDQTPALTDVVQFGAVRLAVLGITVKAEPYDAIENPRET